jgi:hypothetical protein
MSDTADIIFNVCAPIHTVPVDIDKIEKLTRELSNDLNINRHIRKQSLQESLPDSPQNRCFSSQYFMA